MKPGWGARLNKQIAELRQRAETAEANFKAEQERHAFTCRKWFAERAELRGELVKVRAELHARTDEVKRYMMAANR